MLAPNTFASTVTLNDGATLNIGFANEVNDEGEVTTVKNGSVDELKGSDTEGAKAGVNFVFAADLDTEKFPDKVSIANSIDKGDKIVLNNNLLFDYAINGEKVDGITLDQLDSQELTVSKKDSSEVAAGVAANGANGNQAGTIAAFVDGLSGNAQADNITNQISTLVQSGNVKGAAGWRKKLRL